MRIVDRMVPAAEALACARSENDQDPRSVASGRARTSSSRPKVHGRTRPSMRRASKDIVPIVLRPGAASSTSIRSTLESGHPKGASDRVGVEMVDMRLETWPKVDVARSPRSTQQSAGGVAQRSQRPRRIAVVRQRHDEQAARREQVAALAQRPERIRHVLDHVPQRDEVIRTSTGWRLRCCRAGSRRHGDVEHVRWQSSKPQFRLPPNLVPERERGKSRRLR